MVRVGEKVIALFAFTAQKSDELSFQAKNILTVTQLFKDYNWVYAQNEHNETGLIPISFVENVDTASKSWFCPDMNRSAAEKALRKRCDGTFLIRLSSKFVGDYTLSVVHNGEVQHYRIECRVVKQQQANGSKQIKGDDTLKRQQRCVLKEYRIDADIVFHSLQDLITHYRGEADGLCCALTESVSEKAQAIIRFLELKNLRIQFYEVVVGEKLGSGEFADVFRAQYKDTEVAVKCLRDYNDESSKETLLKEAYTMFQLNHRNIIGFLGFYEKPVKNPTAQAPTLSSSNSNPTTRRHTVALLMEYMNVGSLLHYLQSRGRNVVTKAMQWSFSQQVADAMFYLEERGFVHRDLAARNILLNEQLQAKVSDFGMMCRQTWSLAGSNENQSCKPYEKVDPSDICSPAKEPGERERIYFSVDDETSEHSSFRNYGRIPVKWTAPEAIKDKKFTNKSDVWSYGILLWEIYSFGRMPYPSLSASVVCEHVERGYRMGPPPDCSPLISQLMAKCWDANPEERPTFCDINRFLNSKKDALT